MFTHSKSPETCRDENIENRKNLILKLNMIQIEMRHQRADLSTIKRQLHHLNNNFRLQKQVDEYFEETQEQPPEEAN